MPRVLFCAALLLAAVSAGSVGANDRGCESDNPNAWICAYPSAGTGGVSE